MENKQSLQTESFDIDSYKFDIEEFFEWLGPNINQLPKDLQKDLYTNLHIINDIKDKIESAENAVEKVCIDLLMKQYPVFAIKNGISEARDDCRTIWINTNMFLTSLVNKIIAEDGCNEQTKKVFFETYEESPLAEELSPPILLNDSDRNNFPGLTNEQWKKKCGHYNQDAKRYYKFHLRRMNEYMAVMRKTLSRYFPEINHLSPAQENGLDFLLTNGYRFFRGYADQLQKVYDYGFEFNYCHKSPKELSKIISKLDKKVKAEVKAIEKRRLLGEKI